MKNVGTLFRFEMKKIWSRKLVWAALILAACVFVFQTAVSETGDFQGAYPAADGHGGEVTGHLSAREQFRLRMEGAKRLSGQPMDDAFFRTARETIPLSGGREEIEAYFVLEDPGYCDFYRYWGDYLAEGAEQFYESRNGAIEASLSRHSLTADQIAYWRAQEASVEKPFVYRPIAGSRALVKVLGGSLALVLPLLMGILLCDLFSRERRARTDTLIFSTRRGRFPLYLAKILAGVCTALIATAALSAVIFAADMALYGTDGLSAAVQILPGMQQSMLPITAGRGVMILCGVLLVYGVLCAGIVALVSVLSGSAVAALAVSVGVMLLTTQQVDAAWVSYLPANLINNCLISLSLTDFPGVRLKLYQSGALLYLALAAALLLFCWFSWRHRSRAGA